MASPGATPKVPGAIATVVQSRQAQGIVVDRPEEPRAGPHKRPRVEGFPAPESQVMGVANLPPQWRGSGEVNTLQELQACLRASDRDEKLRAMGDRYETVRFTSNPQDTICPITPAVLSALVAGRRIKRLNLGEIRISADQLLALDRRLQELGKTCELALDAHDEAGKLISGLCNFKLVELRGAQTDQWLRFLPALRDLKSLGIYFDLEENGSREVAQELHAGLSACKPGLETLEFNCWDARLFNDCTGFFAQIKRLQVKNVVLHPKGELELRNWFSLGLQRLELQVTSLRKFGDLCNALTGTTALHSLVVRDPTPIAGARRPADISGLVDGIFHNTGLQGLELDVTTSGEQQGSLLWAVAKHGQLKSVRFAFPAELMESVNELKKVRPDLEIVRTTDYSQITSQLNEVIAAAQRGTNAGNSSNSSASTSLVFHQGGDAT